MQWHSSSGSGLPVPQALVPLGARMAQVCLPLSTRCVQQHLLDCPPAPTQQRSPPKLMSIVPAAFPSLQPSLYARKLKESEAAALPRPCHSTAGASMRSTEVQAEAASVLEEQLASGAPLVCVLGQQPGPSRQLACLKPILSTLLGNASTSTSSAATTSSPRAVHERHGNTVSLRGVQQHSPHTGQGPGAPLWQARQPQPWQRALQPQVRAIVICSSQQAAIQAHELAFDLTKKLQGRQRLKLQLVYGGEPLAGDVRMLRAQCPDVLIATPGRLMEILMQGSKARLDYLLGHVELLVLDGSDQLLGFPALRHQCESILRSLRAISQGTSVQLLLAGASPALDPTTAQHVEAFVRLLTSHNTKAAAAAAVQAAVEAASPAVQLQQQSLTPQAHVHQDSAQMHKEDLHPSHPDLQQGRQAHSSSTQPSSASTQLSTASQPPQPAIQVLPVAGSHLLSQLYLTLRSHSEERYKARLPAARVLVIVPSAWVSTVWAKGLKRAGVPTVEVHGGRTPELRSMALQVFNLPPAPPAVSDTKARPLASRTTQSRWSASRAGSSSTNTGIAGGLAEIDGASLQDAGTSNAGTTAHSNSDGRGFVHGRGPFRGSLVMLATPGALSGVGLHHLSLVVQVGLPRKPLHVTELLTHASHVAATKQAPLASGRSSSPPQSPAVTSPSLPALQDHATNHELLQRPGAGLTGRQISRPLRPASPSAQQNTKGLVMLLTPEEAQAGLPALQATLSPSSTPLGHTSGYPSSVEGASTQPGPPVITHVPAPAPWLQRAAYHYVHRALARGQGVPVALKLRAWASILNTYVDHPLAPLDVVTWRRLARSLAVCMRLVEKGPHPLPAVIVHRWGPERCQGLVVASQADLQGVQLDASGSKEGPPHHLQGQQPATRQRSQTLSDDGEQALVVKQQELQQLRRPHLSHWRLWRKLQRQRQARKEYRRVAHRMLRRRAQSRRDYLMRLWEAQEELVAAAPRGSVPQSTAALGPRKPRVRRARRGTAGAPGNLQGMAAVPMSDRAGMQVSQAAGIGAQRQGQGSAQSGAGQREERVTQAVQDLGKRPLFPDAHLQASALATPGAPQLIADAGKAQQQQQGSGRVKKRVWRAATQQE